MEYPLDEVLMIHRLACGYGLEVHAVGIVDEIGSGHLFLGHSGAGKSTTARLWLNQPGVQILSDDRIILRAHGDKIFMYGTPWHGDAGISSPDCAAVTNIYFLEQYGQNEILPLAPGVAAGELFARSFVPRHCADRSWTFLWVSWSGSRARSRATFSAFYPNKVLWRLFAVREIDTLIKRDSRTFAAFCEELLSRGHRVRFLAQGASMRPNIVENDAVIVAPVSDSAVRQGDVLLTQGESGLKVHRLVQQNRTAGTFITRGDSGQQNDPPTSVSFGRVVAIERAGRTIATVGRAALVAAKLNSTLLRLKLGSMRRFCALLSFIFPAALLFLICMIVNVTPADAANADMAVTETTGSGTVSPGGNIVYTIVVTNNGPSSLAVPKWVQATPTNTTFVSLTGFGTWNCTTPAVGGTGNVTCTDNAAMASGGTKTFVLTVAVNAGTPGNTVISSSVTVSATVTTDPTAGNNTATTNVTVTSADLAISQTASAPVVAAGTNVVYTVVVTNNGPSTSQNVVFYENIPTNTTFQSIGAVPAGWTCTNPAVGGTTPPINCTIASLANAGTATFTVTLQVNAATAAETVIQNVTSVTSNTTIDPVASNNTSTTTILVGITGDADLRLTLSALPNPVFVSSPLVYSVAVQNLGVADATSATITNTLPAAVTFVSASVTQGTCTQSAGVVTCNLGTLTASSTATATINVTAPGTSTSLTDTASTTSGVTDPFPSNNSASLVTFVQPLTCATPARDGAGGTLSGNVNTYYAPSAPVVLSPGANTVTLGAASGSITPISIGDLLLVIQMQDAAINFTNTGAYGDGTPGDPATGSTNANSSGRYEFVTATSALSTAGGALTFSGAGPGGGILNTYTEAAYSAGVQGQRSFQVIRVPQYQSATLKFLTRSHRLEWHCRRRFGDRYRRPTYSRWNRKRRCAWVSEAGLAVSWLVVRAVLKTITSPSRRSQPTVQRGRESRERRNISRTRH